MPPTPPRPSSIPIPPPPPLDPSTSTTPPQHEPTNTLALLLPHQSLFAPPVLALLQDYYSQYGEIVHWAPVRGFGRVIIVWREEGEAERAKTEGDWLRLDLSGASQGGDVDNDQMETEGKPMNNAAGGGQSQKSEQGYFTPKGKHRRRKSQSAKIPTELILRLHYLPPTPLNPDPSTFHLAPPSIPHNFLISPPGSPPEGWEPILEDAPNTSILAEDLQRALEALQLNGGKKGGKEVILEEGGVRVEVEDLTVAIQPDDSNEGEDRWEVREMIDESSAGGIGGAGVWGLPSQSNGIGSGYTSLMGTPGFKTKIAPTARPPM
ncbi:hypothetical protein CI109_105051 [Kwoniella shandongensis]|uniref:Uncharacterized protein n=1 Tax=Kwoniella shandongensis TaxID=1734106 RepID=A0A5M6C212_9TREE|nr:uncharacterized protein CI109_004349 [Kwoniella shandongensis]KAA5527289.1 hypothetical protein CI109_004349 [Kwoniella shandongensis]